MKEQDRRDALKEVISFSESKAKQPIGSSLLNKPLFAQRTQANQEESSAHVDEPPTPIFTWRLGGFIILIFLIVLGSLLSIIWFENNSYYVGLDHSNLAIYQGRPGGLAWFNPHLVDKTAYTPAQVLPSDIEAIRHGVLESSETNAIQYIVHLIAEKNLAERYGVAAPSRSKNANINTSANPSSNPGSQGTSLTSAPPSSTTSSSISPSSSTSTQPTSTTQSTSSSQAGT